MTQPLNANADSATGSQPHTKSIGSQPDNASKPVVLSSPGWVSAFICCLLTLAVWLVFGQTLHHEFVNFDDDIYVYRNPTVTQGLSLTGIVWAFTHRHGDNWHPLTTLSHMLDCELYGLKPSGHHLTNLLLHAATAILLFLLLSNLTKALWPSAFIAAVFAVHPLRVESVAWVAERKDVLSGLFFILTLGAYCRYVRWTEVRRGMSEVKPLSGARVTLTSKDYRLALLLFALGLLSKPMLVTLPFVLVLLDYWPLNRFNPTSGNTIRSTVNRLAWEKVPFLLLSAASCVATILAQDRLIESARNLNLSVWSRIGNALIAYATYIRQMIYPADLAVLYPHPGNQLSVWTVGWCVALLGFITVGVARGWRKRPYLLVGWLWFMGMLVPVIGLLQVGNQARADRYTYLPQIGLYIMVAWGAVDLCGAWRHRRVVLSAAAALILASLLVRARAQTRYWRDSVSLWKHTLACTSGNFVAHNNLGNALVQRGMLSEAVAHYERVLQLKPDYAEAHNNLGLVLGRQGKWTEAMPYFERVLQLKTGYAEAHYNLGYALGQLGKLNEAISHFERALQLKPDYASAQNAWGVALGQQGNWQEAIPHFQRALQLNPDSVEARNNLALALSRQGK